MSEPDGYEEGFDAFLNGKLKTENPYDSAAQEHLYTSWNDGWIAAAEDEDKEYDS